MTRDPLRPLSRRALLGAVGTAALGGCADVANPFSTPAEPTYLDGDELASATTRSVPAVPETIPAPPSTRYLDRAERQARDQLSTVPVPLTARDVPNGAIRNEITDAHDSARENLERASMASSPFETARFLRFARSNAVAAATGWRAIDGDLDRATVLADGDAVLADLNAFRRGIEYVGDDVLPAVLVYDAVELLTSGAVRDLDALRSRFPTGPVGPPVVGRMAGAVEAARAATADAAHIDDRHRRSLQRTRQIESRIERASATLSSLVDEGRDALPAERPDEPSALVDGDVSETPAEWLLQMAIFAIYGSGERIRRLRDEGRFARAVTIAYHALTATLAFERVRDRIESGERFRVESVAQVRQYRSTAIDVLESTIDSAVQPDLRRARTTDVAGMIRSTDEHLGSGSDRRTAEEVGEDAVEYVWAAEIAAAIPPAAAEVISSLDGTGARSSRR